MKKRACPVEMAYITVPSRAVALRLGKAVVQEKLAACANILGPITAIYEWKSRIRQEREFVLILKVSRRRTNALAKRVKALHPYDNPCFVTLPLASGLPPFLKWVLEQTDRH